MLTLLLLACGTPLDSATDTASVSNPETPDFPYDGAIHEFGLVFDPVALASLDADPETDVHATFTYGDESMDVGVHLKGHASFQDMSGKPSFKIDFHQWNEAQTFHGVERLALNSMVQDASMSSEHTAYWLYGQLGLAAGRHGYASVTVNGEPYGLYGAVEVVDENFLHDRFEDDGGNLYEGGYGGDVQEGCARLFEWKEEGEPADGSDIQQLVDTILATTPDTYADVLSATFDTDRLFDMWAADLVSANADSYTTLGNNFYLYHEPSTDRWTMIPSGPDQAYIGEMDVNGPYGGALAERCAASAACKAELDDHIRHVLDVWESADLPGFVADRTVAIETACRSDPRSPWGDYGCRDAQAAMRAWVVARPARVVIR